MEHRAEPVADAILAGLLLEATRRCDVPAARLLRASGAELARHPRGQQPAAWPVLAIQHVELATEVLELQLLAPDRRELEPVERRELQAVAEAVRRHLSARIRPRSDRENALQARLAAALDFVTDVFISLASDWTILHVNRQFERLLRCRREDVVGQNLWEAFPEIVGSKFESEVRLAMATQEPRVYEDYSPKLRMWAECRAYPCNEGLSILTIDITERKTDELTRADIEQKLLQAQRMEALGTLAGGIAHDFNNILGAILGHVGLLREQLPDSGPVQASVEQIGIAGARARDLVQRILNFSRTNPREFIRQPLRPLVRESLALLHATLPASVRLEEDLGSEPLAATVNPSELHQVLLNLCTNAWHALPEARGSIRVALRGVTLEAPSNCDVGRLMPGRYAELTVTDDGAGMDASTRARLFEPFFTTKPHGVGTGLGLHVLRGIVVAHSGAVVVESQPGQGSSFHVYLPAVEGDEPGPQDEPRRRPVPGHGERVAYVDDDEVMLLMVEQLLQRAGFETSTFSSPLRLIEALNADPRRFDLVVTDHGMPEMSGLALTRTLRRLRPGLPVILSSGFVSDELRTDAARDGVADLLHKENTYEELAEMVARALRTPP